MNKNTEPSKNEFGKIRSFLAKSGVSQSKINEVIGSGAQGRTRQQVADELRAWLKDRPKA